MFTLFGLPFSIDTFSSPSSSSSSSTPSSQTSLELNMIDLNLASSPDLNNNETKQLSREDIFAESDRKLDEKFPFLNNVIFTTPKKKKLRTVMTKPKKLFVK